LISGHVEIHGFWGFLLVGFSYQHAWFVRSAAGKLPFETTRSGTRAVAASAERSWSQADGRGLAETASAAASTYNAHAARAERCLRI
jgi:hypothetical protein